MNKLGQEGISSHGIIIGLVVTLLFLIPAILWFTGWNIPQLLDFLIPDLIEDKPTEFQDYGFNCPIYVAKVKEIYIHFCTDTEECKETEKSEFYLGGNYIYADAKDGPLFLGKADPKVGNIFTDTFIYLDSYILNGVGTAENPNEYFELKAENIIPAQQQMLSLHNSYFLTSDKLDICRNTPISLEKERKKQFKTHKEIVNEGKTFYFNLDEYIKNKADKTTQLYLNSELTQKAESYLDEYAALIRLPEQGEEVFEKKEIDFEDKIIQKSEQDPSKFKSASDGNYKKLLNPVDNTDNKLGINTGGDPFTHALFTADASKHRIYIKLINEETGYDDESPWTLIEYWNAYRTFANIPDWAVCKTC